MSDIHDRIVDPNNQSLFRLTSQDRIDVLLNGGPNLASCPRFYWAKDL